MALKDWVLKNWLRTPQPPPKYICLNRTVTGAAVTHDAFYTVPDDYDLHAQFCCGLHAAGPALTINACQLYTRTPGMPDRTTMITINSRPVQQRVESLSVVGDIIVSGGGSIGAYSDFSAGNVNAFTNFYLHGFLIPRLAVLTG